MLYVICINKVADRASIRMRLQHCYMKWIWRGGELESGVGINITTETEPKTQLRIHFVCQLLTGRQTKQESERASERRWQRQKTNFSM